MRYFLGLFLDDYSRRDLLVGNLFLCIVDPAITMTSDTIRYTYYRFFYIDIIPYKNS